jgi:hypothetical protein
MTNPLLLLARVPGRPGAFVLQGYATAESQEVAVLVGAGETRQIKEIAHDVRRSTTQLKRQGTRLGCLTVSQPTGHLDWVYLPPVDVFVEPLRSGLTGLVLVARSDAQQARLWTAPGQSLGAALRAYLMESYHLPLLPAWEDDLLRLLAPWITPWTVTGSIPPGATLNAPDAFPDRIRAAIRQGQLPIPPGPAAPDVPVHTLNGLHAYLRQFGRVLSAPLMQQALHLPGTAPQPAVPRTLYPAQADAVAAIQKTWVRGQRTVWLVGEAGVGKTAMGLAAAYLSLQGRPGRLLVMAPGHLLDKWAREARATLPPPLTIRSITQAAEALTALADLRQPPTGPELWLIGRDTAKLGAPWQFAGNAQRDGTYRCPDCGHTLYTPIPSKQTTKLWTAASVKSPTVANAQCADCHTPLWRAGLPAPVPFGTTAATGAAKRWAPDRLWRRLPRGTFDVMILDEAHEEKGDTAQGLAAARLLSRARRHLLMTGTLLGGKASDLGWLLARTEPRAWKDRGWSPTSVAAFCATYGRSEQVWKDSGTLRREVAGVHPAVFADWLLDKAVFLELADLEANLPEYHEAVHLLPMRDDQATRVKEAATTMRTQIIAALTRGDHASLSHLLHATAVLPDLAWSDQAITTREGVCLLPGQPPLPGVTPKESEVVLTALKAKAQGRRSLVFIVNTGVYDLTTRYRHVLEDAGLTVSYLPAAIPPNEREAWIAAHPADVLLTHPRLVGTGLDLLDYPTVLWVQTGWSLFALRQASRRSWRLGQTRPVDVHYFAYEDTVQETILQALGEKQLAADAIEGRFSAEGLELLGTGQSVLIRVAEAVAAGLAALPDLRQVWTVTPVTAPPTAETPVAAPAAAPTFATPAPAVAVFAARQRRGRLPGQLTLFFDEAM